MSSGFWAQLIVIVGSIFAIFLLLIPVLLQLYERDFFPPAMILAIPYAPY